MIQNANELSTVVLRREGTGRYWKILLMKANFTGNLATTKHLNLEPSCCYYMWPCAGELES